jgi:tRNA1Val (adenine37-N6)-methyltransferase
MAEPYFQFKQFRVYHHRDALKVGTDGVLLGAWTKVTNTDRVLDIGTGTGLIALMLAQKATVEIDAIEINSGAATLAAENFARAPFAGIKAHCANLAEWMPEHADLYDLIVCNPPFFTHAQPPKNEALHVAKHTVSLSPALLFREVKRLLRPNGRFSMILPTQGQEAFFNQAERFGFHVSRQTEVLPLPDRPPKRLLVCFSQQPADAVSDTLIVEEQAGERGYTDEFKALTCDFFVRF